MTCPEIESQQKHPRHGEYSLQLQHLIRLARQPGWKAYAWHRAKVLDAEETGLFRGIADDLKAAMAEQKTTMS